MYIYISIYYFIIYVYTYAFVPLIDLYADIYGSTYVCILRQRDHFVWIAYHRASGLAAAIVQLPGQISLPLLPC